VTIGATKVVYRVKGKKVHVKGIITPKKCPKGGWPAKSEFLFQDGTLAVSKTTIACPKKK
jgi:hypothetical protein